MPDRIVADYLRSADGHDSLNGRRSKITIDRWQDFSKFGSKVCRCNAPLKWTPLCHAPTTTKSMSNFLPLTSTVSVPTIVPVLPLAKVSTIPTETLRVLHVVNGEHFSGAERVQSHLGRCLPKFGVTADFALVKPGRFAQRLESEPSWGKCFRLQMARRFDLRPVKELIQLIRLNDYQLLHAHTPRTALVAALASARTGLPWIYHVHSPAARDSARPLINRINAMIERRSLIHCQRIITVSESLRSDCIALGHADRKISVVHNGVPAICPPRSSTPVVGGRWTIGMVALMRPRKGLEIVLDAMSKLRRDGLDVRLRCIGPFETQTYSDSIDEQIQRLALNDVVDREGFVENVPAVLAEMDAMILPSLYGEGLPMVVLEAMAAAVPVIATRVEGTPEAITHGVEGLLAEPGDAESLADQIRDLITGRYDWKAISAAAKERHQEAFSDDAMARKTAAVYHETLQRV